MFFDGTLEAGIAKALKESKSVICFVSDDGETSKLWQDVWLQDHNFPTLIPARSVAHKLDANSEQASYLSAVCPITSVPFLVVINRGNVEQTFTSTVTKNDFTLRLLSAINMFKNQQSQPAASTQAATSLPQATTSPAPPVAFQATTTSSSAPISSTSATSSSTQLNSSAAIATATATTDDRRGRVETQQAQLLAKAKAEEARIKERARIRKQEAQAAEAGSSTINKLPAQQSYAEEQVKRKKEANSERQRILKQIEHDKQERRDREELRKAAAASTSSTLIANMSTSDTSYSRTSSVPSTNPTARIQVRLLDGSMIKQTFPSDSKVADIRQWLDSNRSDGDHPYTLKQLLTPLPSRNISASEESQTIRDAGLVPTATLILVPVQGFAAAYQQGPGSATGAFFYVLWAYLMGTLFAVINFAKMFLGVGQLPEQSSAGQAEEPPTESGSGSVIASAGPGLRIRTLRDQREDKKAKEEQQLYNGNQLNFEPNKETDDAQEDNKPTD